MKTWAILGNRAFFLKVLEDVRASYWFIPGLMVLIAVLLAAGTVALDANRDALPAWLRLPDDFLSTHPSGARQTLAVIAQSILGIAGVMFSMTLVAVSFAAGNYGPRLIGNFMRDRGNQLSLGILIATFVYALLILRTIDQADGASGDGFVPQHAMAVALALTFLSILTIIYFIHHVPETINVSQITAALGRRFGREVRREIDDGAKDGSALDADWPDGPHDAILSLDQPGYLQRINLSGLRTIADEAGIHVSVLSQPGTFVHPRGTVLQIWGREDLPDDLAARLRACFAVGNEPTEEQNLLFIASQLVEMVARALSPGVNDPNTALSCLNWLHHGLVEALEHEAGFSDRSAGRVKLQSPTYRMLHKTAFTEALPYVATDPMAQARMAWLLSDLEQRATGTDRDYITAERARLLRLAAREGTRPQFEAGNDRSG